jgi:regulator of ribosome biosynthesis
MSLKSISLTYFPVSIDPDHDPSKIARAERKTRTTKNEMQRVKNLEGGKKSTANESRNHEIEQTLATSRVSTASLGK